jgi:hypothetical protein
MGSQSGRQREFLEPGDAADEARQRMIGQIVFDQSAAPLAQSGGERVQSAPGSAGGRVSSDGERRNAGRQTNNAW